MSELEFTSRYGDGEPPTNGCRGDCEATGWVPTYADDADPYYAEQWRTLHANGHRLRTEMRGLFRHLEWWYWRSVLRDMLRGFPCDGVHFVKCRDCGGTGKATA